MSVTIDTAAAVLKGRKRPAHHDAHHDAQAPLVPDTDDEAPVADERTAAALELYETALRLAEADKGTITCALKYGSGEIQLPRRYTAGMIHDTTSAYCADRFIVTQFKNNQDANAKARAERFAKHGRAEDAPWTEEQYVEAYESYVYSVVEGVRAPRQSRLDTLRREIALERFLELVAAHNEQFMADGTGTIAARLGHYITLPVAPPSLQGRRPSEAEKAAHEAARQAYEAWQQGRIDSILSNETYAEEIEARVQLKLAAKEAERKAKADAAAAAKGALEGALGSVPTADTDFSF